MAGAWLIVRVFVLLGDNISLLMNGASWAMMVQVCHELEIGPVLSGMPCATFSGMPCATFSGMPPSIVIVFSVSSGSFHVLYLLDAISGPDMHFSNALQHKAVAVHACICVSRTERVGRGTHELRKNYVSIRMLSSVSADISEVGSS
jgi:hypothetical protein